MVEKILVPVDGSGTMERSIMLACDLIKVVGGTLTVLHVVALPVPIEPNAPIDPRPLERAGERILETARRLVEEDGCKADTLQETDIGNAGHRIVEVAQKKGFTLIVIHARGHSKVANLLLGSVCHTVAHRSPCPVLIVRP